MNEPIFKQGGLKLLMAYLVPFAVFCVLGYYAIQAI